jgi:hypothetical protein
LRWIKKPDRKDRLWFLIWPIVVKLGTTKENGMDTDHKLRIWLEFVRIVGDTSYESKFRITTKDQNGFDYYGQYFKSFKSVIHATKWTCIWCSVAGGLMGAVVFIAWIVR